MHFHFRHSFAAICMACLLVGCSSHNTETTNPSTSNPASSSGNASANNVVPGSSSNSLPPVVMSPNKAGETPTAPSTNNGTTAATTPKSSTAEKPGPAVAATPGAKWTVSDVSAVTVAKNADDTMKALKNVEAKVTYGMISKVGKADGVLRERIGDANNFALEFPVMSSDKRHGVSPEITYARANGKVVNERTNDTTNERPIGTVGKTPTDLTDKWMTIGARELFAGYLDKRSPMSDYVAALTDPKNGYKTTVMERTLFYQGHNMKQYEIVAFKAHGDPKISGASSVALIFDGALHLPVTLTANMQQPGMASPYGLSMDIQWLNNVKIDKNEFEPIPRAPTEKKSH